MKIQQNHFYMKKSLRIILAAITIVAAFGCSSLKKMQEQAENVIVKCDPQVLECIAGSIDATVTVTYPADYFNPKAILEVTPVLVYDGGEVVGEKLYYQGPKVKDNYTVVSPDGQTVTEKIHFDYVKGVEKSVFELRGGEMKTTYRDLMMCISINIWKMPVNISILLFLKPMAF